MHSSTPGAAQAPRQPQHPASGLDPITGRTATHWCWPLHDHRAGYYCVCPRDPTKPLSLAVCDDFGTLVPVPSMGSHCGFAGRPA